MRNFVTLFPKSKNVHLVKDVGQIPYMMQKHYDYKSTLVCYENGNYPYIKEEAKGLNIRFLDDIGKRFFWEKAAVRYLINEAKNIDILNLYHLAQWSMLYGLIYKWLNPKGLLYLKLDFDFKDYEQIKFSDIFWKEYIHQQMYKIFKNKVDIVSVEGKSGGHRIKQLDNELYSKTMIVENGVDIDQIMKTTGKPRFSEKENLILSVGRIGTDQKNSELLLQALSQLDLDDWTVKFVGPIDNEFKSIIDSFFKENPNKKKRVHFTGKISDRKKLLNLYKKGKIFCLTSRWEGSPIVLPEAASMGNYLITSDVVSSADEITDNGKVGTVFESENVKQLVLPLKKATASTFYDETLMNDILTHSQKLNWEKMLEGLNNRINFLISN